MDPGICFHPVYVNSQTQYAWTINIMNCRTKNAAIPKDKGLAWHKSDVNNIAIIHIRIFLCRRQGVIRITVNTMETLAPLVIGEVNITWGESEGPHQTGT